MKMTSKRRIALCLWLVASCSFACTVTTGAGTTSSGRVVRSGTPVPKPSGSIVPGGAASASPGSSASGSPMVGSPSPSPITSALPRSPVPATATPIPLASGTPAPAPSSQAPVATVSPASGIEVLSGKPGIGSSRDGAADVAQFDTVQALCADAAGLVFTLESNIVRRIASDGSVKTIAGLAGTSGSTDEVGTKARFNAPKGMVCQTDGTALYVADTANHTIRKLAFTGDTATVTTIAGAPGQSGADNGTGSAARFNSPVSLALSADAGTLYVVDQGNRKVRQINLVTGGVSNLAGSGNAGNDDGDGDVATFNEPVSILCSADGSKVYVSDRSGQRVRVINTGSKAVSTLAGSEFGDANGKGSDANFANPTILTQDENGTLYLADTSNYRIQKLTASGDVSTVKELPATFITALTFQRPNRLLFSDLNDGRIKTLVLP